MASPDHQFDYVAGALRTEDGSIVVADGAGDALYVRRYSSSGQYLRTWARSGEGPGDFKSVAGMHRLSPDSLVVWDRSLQRITVLQSDGRVARTLRIEAPPLSLKGTLADGGLLFEEIRHLVFRAGVQHPSGRHRYDKTVRTYDREALPIALLGPFPDKESQNTIDGTGMHFNDLPYSRETLVSAWNDLAVVGVSDTYELRVYGSDGSLQRIIRLARPPTPTTEADRVAYLNAWSNRRADPDVPAASHIPLFDRIIGDQMGCLWVRDYRLPGEAPAPWTIFDAAGMVVASTEMPGDLRVWDIGPDYVLASRADSLGVHSVVVLPLDRGRSRPCRIAACTSTVIT